MSRVEELSLTVRPATIHSEGSVNQLPEGVRTQVVFDIDGPATIRILLGEKQQRLLLLLLMAHEHGDTATLRASVAKELHYWRKRWGALHEERMEPLK